LAVRIWPDVPKKTAITKLRDLREPNPTTGKYQHLSLASAFRMAEALDEDANYLISLARGLAERQMEEQGLGQEKAPGSTEPPRAGGMRG
jgi:hypothetical protein